MLKRKQKLIIALLAGLPLIASVSAAADGFTGGVGEALGPRFGAGSRPPVLSRRAQGTGIDSVRYWNEIAIDASGLDHTPVAPGENRDLRRATRARALEPRDGDRPHRDLRCGERDRRRLPELHRSRRPPSAAPRWTPRSRRRRTIRWSRSSPRRRRASTSSLAEDLSQIRLTGTPKTNGIELGQRAAAAILALRANDGSQHAEPRVGIDFIPSDEPGKWRQDPISQIPLALGAYWGEVTVRPEVGRPVPGAASARPGQPGVCGGVRRGEAPGRRRDRHTDGAHRGPDDRRHLLGLRRNAEPVRAAAAVQPDRGADRRSDGLERRRAGAAAGAGQRGDGRRRHRDLGVEVLLRVLASGHRHPRGRPGNRPDRRRRRQSRHRRRSDLHAARRAGQQPQRARTSRRPSRPTRPATPGSAARCSRSCATSTAPTTSPSPSCRTSSTA